MKNGSRGRPRQAYKYFESTAYAVNILSSADWYVLKYQQTSEEAEEN